MTKPLGISEFHHLEQLLEQLEGSLPTIEALEAELASQKNSSEESESALDGPPPSNKDRDDDIAN